MMKTQFLLSCSPSFTQYFWVGLGAHGTFFSKACLPKLPLVLFAFLWLSSEVTQNFCNSLICTSSLGYIFIYLDPFRQLSQHCWSPQGAKTLLLKDEYGIAGKDRGDGEEVVNPLLIYGLYTKFSYGWEALDGYIPWNQRQKFAGMRCWKLPEGSQLCSARWGWSEHTTASL